MRQFSVTPQFVKEQRERCLIIRKQLVRTLVNARSWHLGPTLSATEILATLYFAVMRHDPQNPEWRDRDRLVLSKGHACAVLYVILAQCGYFPEETLWTYKKPDSILQGHPDRTMTPGIEVSTGSLGQGLSAAVGMALGVKMDGKDSHVFCLIGDGESHEGNIWEAAMAAGHYHLNHLIALTDYNKLSSEHSIAQAMGLEPLADKWRSFGWNVIEVDGNDVESLLYAFGLSKKSSDKPTMIIAHTVKGKGVSFMENQVKWHGKQIDEETGSHALAELDMITISD